MASYAIGDIQGCYQGLLKLLEHIDFQPARDRLWFTGDLVNRGPDSLSVLRFVSALGERAVVVLGNHDLHLLAARYLPEVRLRPRDTLDAVLCAPDCDALLTWLRHRPMFHRDAATDYALVHAGLAPEWTITDAMQLAGEVEQALRSDRFDVFLRNMYGDQPDRWQGALRGSDRLRFITNCLTRIRYGTADGRIELNAKGPPGTQSLELIPWFMLPQRRSADTRIVFGHWSTLRITPDEEAQYRVYPLDTGAVWGGQLTAMRLEDRMRFSVPGSAPVASDGD